MDWQLIICTTAMIIVAIMLTRALNKVEKDNREL